MAATEDKFDDKLEEQKTVKALTAKEIKKLARPEFEANPEKFYPTKVFEKFGFSRHKCPKCGAFYWRHTDKAEVCGDAQCAGKYSFIGVGTGIGRKGKKITYAEAWKGFERSFSKAAVPCQAIERYPTVARWRNDVDYVAAGIFCFQPYCVTGELDPPANPLICPQFCVRFNDLDNIGLTGRHYSGFVMIGIQVFNYPDKYVFFKEECVEFNYLWLTQELGVDPDEITFIEDVWAGGGNLGPSIEYFVGGLEVGNMVFMQYKTFHDGSREELPIKIIDTGIGMERIPWFINGSPTSYCDVFPKSLDYLLNKLGLTINNDVWQKIGPYTAMLNVDEVESIDKVWEEIAVKVELDLKTIKDAITPVRELYIILDHCRTSLMIITDGSLPSNVGGGSNIRNILRRVFAILKKNGWIEKLKIEGFLELFDWLKKDLVELYGEFNEYKSFKSIIQLEYTKWLSTDSTLKSKLDKLLKKNAQLAMDDWILAMTSWGIPADQIALWSGQTIPGNLYYEIALRQERVCKAAEVILYNTTHLPETVNLYYNSHKHDFSAKVLDVFANVQKKNIRDIVILDQSVFYPTSGGQANDLGTLVLDGEKYQVVNVEKVGKSVLHFLDRPLPKDDVSHYKGLAVHGEIDLQRRTQLRNNHTGTHLVFAASRRVLGPHVWQHGAKKTVEQAHLDITHFAALSREEELQIENEANRSILACKGINKFFMDKAKAEKEYGFRLYQGGIVPGSSVRVVKIEDLDVEACCGTHCDNTSEVGWIKILKTSRISDGIVRLYYVAGEKAIEKLNGEREILNKLMDLWGISQTQICATAERFFSESKKFSQDASDSHRRILNLEMKYVLDSSNKLCIMKSREDAPTLYISFAPAFAHEFKARDKGIIVINDTFIYGLLGNDKMLAVEKLKEVIAKTNAKSDIKTMNQLTFEVDKKTKIKTEGILQLFFNGKIDQKAVIEVLKTFNFNEVTI